MSISKIALALLGGGAMFAVAGCAIDGRTSYDNGNASSSIHASASTAPAYYRTHQTTTYGRVYTNPDGHALYYYGRDRANRSNCYGNCARHWQPYLASGDARPDGRWSIINRNDGTRQWAYAGRPTYMWSGDRQPGVVTGHGRDGAWSVAIEGQY